MLLKPHHYILPLGLLTSAYAQTASVSIERSSSTRYEANVTVTNDTSATINGWLVTLATGGQVTSNWRSDLETSESSGSLTAFSGKSYNRSLEPGESTHFGFVASLSGGSAAPSSAAIIGNWPSNGGTGNSTPAPSPRLVPQATPTPAAPAQAPPISQPTGLLLDATIDDFPSGLKNDREWKALWPGTKWANGPDEGRLSVDDTRAANGSAKSIRVLYPAGSKQPAYSGSQWFANLNGEYEDLYLSYWVRFEEDFDFVLGGKLPGLGGANTFNDRTNEWSGRLMWRENGWAEFYTHVPRNNDFDPGDRFWWNTEGFQAVFVPGQWHHIEIHMKLNTPGEFDGIMEGWFDGRKAATYNDFYFRDEPTESTKICWVFFSTFFGGSSSDIWNASKDEHANFDQFVVSTSRIGYPGARTNN